jgi:dipeptidase D
MTTLESNATLLKTLEPRKLWEIFGLLLATPRESGHEENIRARLAELSAAAGFQCETDVAGNLIIRVPATAGSEKSPTVVLQGHLDMVCTKRADSAHDFAQDPIRLVRDGDWLKADGTTLGADNGLGVAAALATAFDPEIQHGPLEILFTVDEEVGLTGAAGLAPGWLTGRILLNLDSEETDVIYMGCAGGSGVQTFLPIVWEELAAEHVGLVLKISGLRGGHSGGDIHENRGNAAKFLARALAELREYARIVEFTAGDKRNAIPRHGGVHLAVPTDKRAAALAAVERIRAELAEEFSKEQDFRLALEDAAVPGRVMSAVTTARLVDLLLAIPSGVVAMSTDLPGLVETSTSLATVQTAGDQVSIHSMPRSSNSRALRALTERLQAISRLAGADSQADEPYPGWQPNPNSRVVALAEEVHEKLFAVRPKRLAIHAGLECGVIGEKYPDLDMCSFGPWLVNPHSPDEAVNIESVARFWYTLRELLAAIAQGQY